MLFVSGAGTQTREEVMLFSEYEPLIAELTDALAVEVARRERAEGLLQALYDAQADVERLRGADPVDLTVLSTEDYEADEEPGTPKSRGDNTDLTVISTGDYEAEEPRPRPEALHVATELLVDVGGEESEDDEGDVGLEEDDEVITSIAIKV